MPWRKTADIGNFLRHHSRRAEPAIIWAIVQEQLDPLETVVRYAATMPSEPDAVSVAPTSWSANADHSCLFVPSTAKTWMAGLRRR